MIRYEDIPRSFNVTSWFLDRNLEEGRGDRVALYCGEETVTYGELARLTNRVGHVLLELGVRMEDRVLLALSDGTEFVATWYAALKIGAPPHFEARFTSAPCAIKRRAASRCSPKAE